jgi:hypothetical protein
MWNCNGSASPAVLPERRVVLIVTLLAAADHPLAEDSAVTFCVDFARGKLRPELAAAVSQILHSTMEDELATLLSARPYERTVRRRDHRNRRVGAEGARRSRPPGTT